MITTTLGKLMRAEIGLGTLGQMMLPIKTAYNVGRLISKVEEEAKEYHARRNTLIKELGTPRELTPEEQARGGAEAFEVQLRAENFQVFQTRMEELGSVEVTIDRQPIALASLGEIAMKPEDLVALEDFIVDDIDAIAEVPAKPLAFPPEDITTRQARAGRKGR